MGGTAIGKKYNYRDEWARFVATLSAAGEEDSHELAARILKAVGGVIGADGGALWLHEAGTSFRLVAKQNFSREACRSGDAPVLAVWLVTHDEILDLSAGEHARRMVDLPDWVPAPPASWLLLPLQHRGWLVGFMILSSAHPRHLDRDDRDVLWLASSNAASYLAEDERNRELREVKAFELFNRRFAYVMHDLKNMSAQLALTHSNAARHKDNQEFVSDMIDTVGASVRRINSLIARLRGDSVIEMREFEVDRLLQEILDRHDYASVRLTRPLRRLVVKGDRERLRTAIEHVLDNARQSLAGGAEVALTLRAVAEDVRIEVADNGRGMDARFIQERLFAPFASTKSAGFGLGMTETREIVEQMNGRILIESEPDAGTTMVFCLPRIFEEAA